MDVPGQLDHPCCASFGLAICHTGSVFVLALLSYMSPACMSMKQVLGVCPF